METSLVTVGGSTGVTAMERTPPASVTAIVKRLSMVASTVNAPAAPLARIWAVMLSRPDSSMPAITEFSVTLLMPVIGPPQTAGGRMAGPTNRHGCPALNEASGTPNAVATAGRTKSRSNAALLMQNAAASAGMPVIELISSIERVMSAALPIGPRSA
jgi:hypothetical protein